jgi:glycosyltransferase involved in cell wall biosynthesis
MNNSFKYLPPEQRKKILLICDDIRVHSGVATVGREIVIQTAQHFNWVNLGGAIKHPEEGKRLDLSQSTNDTAGLTDSSVMMYPVNDYGNPDILRNIIKFEKPDAIMLITDPRYFIWLFSMENEIRKSIPITYLNIWDDYPAPLYNKPYYEACDLLMGISKQTVNINKLVLGDKAKNKIIKYVPHGLNHELISPIDKNHEKWNELQEFKKQLFGGKEYEFVLFFNSRNIRRKQIPDTMLAYRHFIDQLPVEQAKKCCLLLHTELVSEHGTDLPAVQELLLNGEQYNVVYTNQVFNNYQMNLLYNSTDCQIQLTSNEGWGLSLTEAMLAGNPIIANVTGGMQDQMRFEFEDGTWIDFDADFPSNHRGTIKKHGEWAFPVYPTSRSIVGSPPTPYIYDDRCESEDAANQIKVVYDLGKEERKAKGLKGREWVLGDEAGFTGEYQGKRVIEAFDELFATWKPREKFELIDTNEVKDRVINHKLLY